MNDSNKRLDILLHLINSTPRTIDEIELQMGDNAYRCPDDLTRALNILRKRGLIKGTVSRETGRIEWWK